MVTIASKATMAIRPLYVLVIVTFSIAISMTRAQDPASDERNGQFPPPSNGLFGLTLPTFAPLNLTFPTLPPLTIPCIGTSSLQQGSCRQNGDCGPSGGYVDGLCFQGFGSCCVAPSKCGTSSLVNNTHFSNVDYPSTSTSGQLCELVVQKISLDVVQLRVEFVTFELAQPDESSGQCTQDALVIQGLNPDFSAPRLCGKASGQHLILPVDQSPSNRIVFRFAVTGSASSKWLIRVVQMDRLSPNLASPGCLQYHYGSVQGNTSSLNFDAESKVGLGNIDGLRYSICFRREAGFCAIRFSPVFLRSKRHTAGYVYPRTQQSLYHQHNVQNHVKYVAQRPVTHQYHQNVQTVRHPQPKHMPKPYYTSYKYPIKYSNFPAVKVQGYRPPYQSPFESGWFTGNNSSYVAPLPSLPLNGSEVLTGENVNTADATVTETVDLGNGTTSDSGANTTDATVTETVDLGNGTTSGSGANTTDATVTETVDLGNGTTSGSGANTTDATVTETDDLGNETTSGSGANTTAIVDRPEVLNCQGEDTINFPPIDTFCSRVGARTVALNVSPFVVYVDNHGSSHSKGFLFSYNHQAC